MLHCVCKGIQSALGNALKPDNTSATLSLSLSRQSASLLIMVPACLNFPFITYLCALVLFSTPIYENHSPSTSQLLVYPVISHFRSPFTDALRFFFDSISNLRCLCPLDHLPQCDLIVMAKFYMYADDTTIYVAASSPGTVVVLNVILQKLYD